MSVLRESTCSILPASRCCRSFEHLAALQDIEEPAGASEVEIARARSATLA
ncbi:hypothetical protein QCM77_03335 [Bradyrhizobium sp. SSUT18]|uniref:hypothetical protein n=1 Tax=unclassified Bradyrhizobium TaxID=2631580 RepID=UPI002448C401|nr:MULTISPECIES: hypothetical protein [unclassified Bradyrhizobium]MDH2352599.1 hypothetical protein [Bradyrhizobium sp. SSUT112]MDH2399024.1 hypothetical protein [Bradyrhizobium sp. SSUT18]